MPYSSYPSERALASLQTAADVKVKELKAALEEHK